jgi:hypothetical protein
MCGGLGDIGIVRGDNALLFLDHEPVNARCIQPKSIKSKSPS